MMMDSVSLEETLKSEESCIFGAKWHLSPSSRCHLQTDILALCMGLWAVVLVDYRGKMPELQERPCALVRLLHLESTIMLPLRVMVTEDMIYLVHVIGLVELISLNLSSYHKLLLVDLKHNPFKILLHADSRERQAKIIEARKKRKQERESALYGDVPLEDEHQGSDSGPHEDVLDSIVVLSGT